MLLKVRCEGREVLLPVAAISCMKVSNGYNTRNTVLGYRKLEQDMYDSRRPSHETEPYIASHHPDVVADAIEAALAYTARRDIPLPSFNQDGKELVYAWVLDLTRTKITLEKMPVPVEREQISFGKATIDIKDNNPA